MSVFTPAYGVTEAMETKVIKSRVMVRLNAHDIINHALQKLVTIVDPKFVEFADNGDLVFQATIIKPVETVINE